jgi:hypothetical protein
LKKLAFFSVLAGIVLAGCGGSGGDDSGGVGTPTDNFAVNTSLLNKPGLVTMTFNTGQGRGVSSVSAVVRQFALFDTLGGVFQPALEPQLTLGLDAYTSQGVDINVPMGGFSTNLNGRTLTDFAFNVKSITVDGQTTQGPGGNPLLSLSFDLFARASSGRSTSVQIFLDDAMFTDNGNGGFDFDQAMFESINYDPDLNSLVGYFSDYIAFDISNVANKPQMLDSTDADWVAFSGDFIALAKSPGSVTSPTPFEVLVPLNPDPGALEGTWHSAPSFPTNAPGAYTLKQLDPRNLPLELRIRSLDGTWKPWLDLDNPSQSPFTNPTDFVFITFPQSNDNGVQDLVMFSHTNGVVDAMYFGECNLNNGTFAAWPIDQVDDGDASNEINGTMGAYIYRGGIGSATSADIRSGTWTLTSPAPSGFPGTGRFVVYRL